MIALLCSIVLFVSAPLQDEEKKGPDPARVEAAVDSLDTAFKKSEPEVRIQAIRAAADVLHADVIARISKGLKDKTKDVQLAAVEALRWMDHPKALDSLHNTYKRSKAFKKDDELSGALLKAIGQHGDATSIPILSDNPFGTPNHAAITARIYGLGNVRSKKSVEALMALMQKSGGRRGGGGRNSPYMTEIRLSLIVLTGTDQGKTRDLWIRWWNDNKKKFEVPEELPPLPPSMQRTWQRYWGLEDDSPRRKRREDRGKDPEGGR